MDRADIIGLLPGIVAPLLVYLGIVTANRMQRGTQREMYPTQVITDLRKEIEGLRVEVRDAKKEASEARAETREAAVRERIRDDYIHKLRDHISTGKRPPPPDWPEGLTT